MILLTGPTVLLLLTAFCQCLSSVQEVELLYPSSTITNARGSSVKLTCLAKYQAACGLVKVAWYQLNETDDSSTELTTASRYDTMVNETVQEDGSRRRQVTTEILNLTHRDNGIYQCKAVCDRKGNAQGHYVYIEVTG